MFGYIKTDLPNMYVKDTVLYQAMYCGLCKGIGKTCGTKARFVLNYDLTFLSVLLHNLTNVDVKVEKEHCIVHPIRKKPIAQVDKLTERIAYLNVILAYHKLNDDVLDNGKGKLKRSFFRSAYKKAKNNEPKIDEIVKNLSFNKLILKNELESEIDALDELKEMFSADDINYTKIYALKKSALLSEYTRFDVLELVQGDFMPLKLEQFVDNVLEAIEKIKNMIIKDLMKI